MSLSLKELNPCYAYAYHHVKLAAEQSDVMKFQQRLPELDCKCLKVALFSEDISLDKRPIYKFIDSITADEGEKIRLGNYASRVLQVGLLYKKKFETTPNSGQYSISLKTIQHLLH